MKRNFRSRRTGTHSAPDPAAGLRDSAQKIWLAGLGALERARTDGPRMFESLVEQGRNMGARAVGVADEALKAMRQADYSGAHVEELSRQVRELSESMRRFMSGAAGAASTAAQDPAAAGPRPRKAPGAAAKRRRKAKAAGAKAAAATRAPRAKKARATKPRKPSRGPRTAT